MKKTALITGSSRGIGKAIALRLARDGYHVLVHCAGNLEKARAVCKEIEAVNGSAELIQANLCNTDETQHLLQSIQNVDVLVLNASVQYRNAWQNISLDECYHQLNCNFVSSLLLIQSVVDHMRAQKWGRIITIGSVQEAKPHPDMLIYSASKAAQSNMIHSLSLQLAKDGITVNNVAPGVIYTDRNVEALSDPEYAKKVTDSIPVGFYGEPQDLAGIVSLLCSQDGRYITGQNIYVDGGKSVQ